MTGDAERVRRNCEDTIIEAHHGQLGEHQDDFVDNYTGQSQVWRTLMDVKGPGEFVQ
jgi:RecA-family ATPase